jgi:hypothetical protein
MGVTHDVTQLKCGTPIDEIRDLAQLVQVKTEHIYLFIGELLEVLPLISRQKHGAMQ